MSHEAAFTNIVHEQYGAHNATVQLFSGSSNDERAAFQVDLPHGERWIVHAQHGDVPIPAWLDGCGTPDAFTLFLSRAQTLAYLEQQNYPAPRVVRTHSGALTGDGHGWVTLAAGGAWHFMQGRHKGWDRVASILTRRQHRYEVSDRFAFVAHQRVEQYTEHCF